MTPTDRPLHVRVAEALGWHTLREVPGRGWWGYATPTAQGPIPVTRFDRSWAATGPLIEKYGIDIEFIPGRTGEWRAYYCWRVGRLEPQIRRGEGPTPLIAVCELLIKLGEAGKLEKP